jgi:hypothetical protein
MPDRDSGTPLKGAAAEVKQFFGTTMASARGMTLPLVEEQCGGASGVLRVETTEAARKERCVADSHQHSLP